ncbi:hypothetical protein [Halorubrum sp. DM2]|uniref:hypothetical protein n=1 Tax=Halorubrum sp. DM2 TaxID=2527867 RepID=UPI0024B7482A|nr:hypothetical protein [Halorubrum sp. DM2]
MTTNLSEDDILARIRDGLRDAVEGHNLNWTYGTKIQKQKYVDLALNHYIGPILTEEGQRSPITRSWYKYGCVQTASTFQTNLTTREKSQEARTLTEANSSSSEDWEAKLKTEFEPSGELLVPEEGTGVPPAQHPIADHQSAKFTEFFLDTDLSPPLDEEHWVNKSDLEFLEPYYIDNAPPEVQDLYLANLALRQTLTDAYQTAQHIDENRAKLLTGDTDLDVDWTPKSYARDAGQAAVKLRLAIRQSSIVPDSLIDPVLKFTDLVEDLLLALTKLDSVNIRTRHYRVIKQVDEFLDGKLWEWIARYISHATVVGPRAASWRKDSRKRIAKFAEECPSQIESLRTNLHQQGLLPAMSEYNTAELGAGPAEQFMAQVDDAAIRNLTTESTTGDDNE